MSSTKDGRVIKELRDLLEDKETSGIHAEPIEDSLTNLKGWFLGPGDTPYAGGKYVIRITLDDQYPFKPPAMQFETKIWHPNVSSQTGVICLDILKTNWSPVQTIKTALLSIRMLLENPNPSDPQDAEVADMLMSEPHNFVKKAHGWAVTYADAPFQENLDLDRFNGLAREQPKSDDEAQYRGYNPDMVAKFTNMGFDIDKVTDTFISLGIYPNDGRYYPLSDVMVEDITTQLLRGPEFVQ